MRKKTESRVVLLLLLFALILGGCSTGDPDPQTTAEVIRITQVNQADQEFTVEQLKEFTPVERDVESISSSGEVTPYSVKGTVLADVLSEMGITQGDLDAIRLVAGDGYSIEVGNEVLTAREIILAYEINGEPLLEDSRPVRVIIPEERAMYWVRNLVRIEILQVEAAAAITELMVMEAVVEGLTLVDYESNGAAEKAITVTDLIEWVDDEQPIVHLASADGLRKNEVWDNFIKGVIRWTGPEAPAFVSNDLPVGMHVKDIIWIQAGEVGYISASQFQNLLSAVTVEGKTGVSLEEVLAEIGFETDSGIRLIATDGYTVEISQADIARGIVYLDDAGQVWAVFRGLPKNTAVKNLLKIEAVN